MRFDLTDLGLFRHVVEVGIFLAYFVNKNFKIS